MRKDTINILRIVEYTTVDGPGFRTVVYASGCRHRCPGCHNPESWDINGGRAVKIEDVAKQLVKEPFTDITFSGGDPLEQAEEFAYLAFLIKKYSRKNIWCYTGYRYEEIITSDRLSLLLPHIDILVDGKFRIELRDENALFRGSTNQRLIDVKKSLSEGKAVVADLAPKKVFAATPEDSKKPDAILNRLIYSPRKTEEKGFKRI